MCQTERTTIYRQWKIITFRRRGKYDFHIDPPKDRNPSGIHGLCRSNQSEVGLAERMSGKFYCPIDQPNDKTR